MKSPVSHTNVNFPGDRVIENPPDGIGTGAEVRLAVPPSSGTLAGRAKNKNEQD